MMRMQLGLARTTLTVMGLLGASGAVQAQVPGYTLPQANLRAGPSRDFPLISQIPPGQPVELFGCVGRIRVVRCGGRGPARLAVKPEAAGAL